MPSPRPAPCRSGFSIVEAVVVIALCIIALVVLSPNIDVVPRSSNRAACASNLRQQYGGLMGYYNAYSRSLPQTFNSTDAAGTDYALYEITLPSNVTVARSPAFTNPLRWNLTASRLTTPTGVATDACINLTTMRPFTGSPSSSKVGVMGGVWRCPSSDSRDSFINAISSDPNGIEGWYSYFCMPTWPGSGASATTNQPQSLTAHDLDSKRIILTDTLFRDAAGAWSYNHGKTGSSDHRIPGGDTGPVPKNFVGMNQCWGDGSVRWVFLDPARTKLPAPFDPAVTGATPPAPDWGYAGSSVANDNRNFFILK